MTIILWQFLSIELTPQTDADEIDVELRMAQGTNIALVNQYLQDLDKMVDEITPMDQIKHITAEMRSEQKLNVNDAVLQAGRLRLRPILMTTTTTILGMLPLAIVAGVGGEIQASLARAVIGGLSVSTLITLILIPVVYTSIHEFVHNRAVRKSAARARI